MYEEISRVRLAKLWYEVDITPYRDTAILIKASVSVCEATVYCLLYSVFRTLVPIVCSRDCNIPEP